MNQYTSIGGTSYTYDPNGNLTGDGTKTYAYDYENRLVSVTGPGLNATYAYDGFGRRVKKTVNGSTTYFLHDGDQVIEERDGANQLQATYTYGSGIDETLTMNRASQTYYYFQDGLGSVTDLTQASGEEVESYSYDVYGQPSAPSIVGNPYLYTGRELDPETNLYYYRARYYHPGIGRFMQRDPWSYVDSFNLYTYVINNPVNWIDPFGLITEVIFEEPIRGNPNRYGHSSVRVDDKVYEVQKIRDDNGKVHYRVGERKFRDVIKDDRPEKRAKVPLPPNKEAELKRNLDKQVGRKYDYNYVYDNCANFVEDELRKVDVDLPNDYIETPEDTLEQAKELPKPPAAQGNLPRNKK